jgi:ABC-type branched-subunit amino acid transport system substrate-binding protein
MRKEEYKMKRRTMVLVVFATVSLLVLSGVQSVCAAPLKIGVAGAFTGDLASYGLPTVNAAKLVVKDINAKGGINGQPVELVIEDDQCKPELATNAAAKVVSAKVVAVIGHICSGATKAALGIYKDSKLVTISPSATNPPLTQSGEYPNFFRTIAPDDAQARLAATFLTKTLKLKKIAVLTKATTVRASPSSSSSMLKKTACRSPCSRASTQARQTTLRSSTRSAMRRSTAWSGEVITPKRPSSSSR